MNPQRTSKPSVCFLLIAASVLGTAFSQNASAGLILQDQASGNGIFQSPYYNGQTFTAEDPFILTIGIGVMVGNPTHTPRSITMNLYSGRGVSGSVLGTRSVDPAPAGPFGTVLWMDFDFSGIELSPGQVYSFSYTSPGIYWAGQSHQWAIPNGPPIPGRLDYAGGEAFNSFDGFRPHEDLRFRVVPVPEPSTNLLIAAGLGLVTMRAFRRKRK